MTVAELIALLGDYPSDSIVAIADPEWDEPIMDIGLERIDLGTIPGGVVVIGQAPL